MSEELPEQFVPGLFITEFVESFPLTGCDGGSVIFFEQEENIRINTIVK
jgi:hypothetical protein